MLTIDASEHLDKARSVSVIVWMPASTIAYLSIFGRITREEYVCHGVFERRDELQAPQPLFQPPQIVTARLRVIGALVAPLPPFT